MKIPHIAFIFGLALVTAASTSADQSLAGNVTITGGSSAGNLMVTGGIDADGAVSLGALPTPNASYPGVLLNYTNDSVPTGTAGTADSLKFLVNRSPASWLWLKNAGTATAPVYANVMRLDSAHKLILFQSDSSTAGITLTPGSSGTPTSTLALGTATLSGTGGAFTATGNMNFTGTDGSLAVNSGGVVLSAAGTAGGNKNITLAPSGTGSLVVTGNSTGKTLAVFSTGPLAGDINTYFRVNASRSDSEIQVKSGAGAVIPLLLQPDGGSVGIGTPMPATTLDIQSPAASFRVFGTGTNDVPQIQLRNVGQIWQWKLDGADGNKLKLNDGGGTSRLTMDTAGNVGIGTTGPGNKLHVLAGGFAGDGLKIEGNATNQYPALTFAANGAASPRSWTMSVRGGSAGQFNLDDGTAGLTRLAIDSTGNLGIGTPSPEAKLQVLGGNFFVNSVNDATGGLYYGGASNGLIVGKNATSPWPGTNGLFVGGNSLVMGNVGIGTTSPGSRKVLIQSSDPANDLGVEILMGRTTGTNYGLGVSTTGLGASLNQGIFTTARDGASNFGLRIYNVLASPTNYSIYSDSPAQSYFQGNVGIGTASPGTKLDVNGNISLNYGHLLLVPGAGSVTTDGNYGIYWQSNGAGSGDSSYGLYRTAGAWTANNYQQLMMKFATGIVIDGGVGYGKSGTVLQPNGGNVGIGTSSPSTKLNLQDTQTELSMGLNADPTTYNRFGFNTSYQGYWAQNATWNGAQWNHVVGGGYNGAAVKLQQYYGTFQIDTANSGVTADPIAWNTRFFVANNGYIGIGTTSPTHLLSVKGAIRAQEVIVDNTNWADYVFDSNYRLAPLSEVESHIKAEKHLPGIPSAAEIAEHGVSMGDMQAKLLSKIEEITLHQIAQEKQLNAQAARIAQLELENRQLKAATNQ